MKKQNKPRWMFTIFTIALVSILYLPKLIGAGDMEPPGPPAPTMKTLDETPPTWSQILDSTDGDPDGCNSSRFECVMGDQAVLDKETGLVWERSPEATTYNWFEANYYCIAVTTVGGRKGWRLATAEELQSLVDPTLDPQTLPTGHPFINVPLAYAYWTATSGFSDPANLGAYINMSIGGMLGANKSTGAAYKWCVRGGRGIEGQ